MANLCSFCMQVNGKHENIEKFFNALSQNGNMWMGRGAEADIRYEDESGRASIVGSCKWSIQSALIDNAMSMKSQKETGEGHWGDLPADTDFITLWDACKKYHVNMEVYSEESGCCFQEHYKYENGKTTADCVDYYEYCIIDYETKEEAEKEFDIKITDEEWESEEYVSRGGFENWNFDLADVA